MLLKVKKAVYLLDYKIKLTFSNRITKIVDFKDWIFENEADFYLIPLRTIEYFQKFSLDESGYTICWPNGAEFCPDVLYAKGKEIKKSKKRIGLKKRKTRSRI